MCAAVILVPTAVGENPTYWKNIILQQSLSYSFENIHNFLPERDPFVVQLGLVFAFTFFRLFCRDYDHSPLRLEHFPTQVSYLTEPHPRVITHSDHFPQPPRVFEEPVEIVPSEIGVPLVFRQSLDSKAGIVIKVPQFLLNTEDSRQVLPFLD